MPWSRSRPSTEQRGMGHAHRKLRAAYIAALARAGVGRCCLGGEPIYAEQDNLPNAHPRKLVLDHCTCRTGCDSCGWTGYRGLACWDHNMRDGSKRGRARQTATRLRW